MQGIIRTGSRRLVAVATAAVIVTFAGIAAAGTGDPSGASTLKQSAIDRGITDFKNVWSGAPAGLPKALISNNNANWDGVNGGSSEHNTYVTDSRMADDIVPPSSGCTQVYSVTAATGVMLTYPGMTSNANLEIYCDNGNKPAEDAPVCTANTTNNSFLGTGFGFYDIRRYNFNGVTGCNLKPGTRYWVSVVQNGGAGQGFFATACNGICFGNQSYFKSAFFGYPTWTPGNAIFGSPTDLAFTVSANCVSGSAVSCAAGTTTGGTCDLTPIEAKLDELKPEVVDIKSEIVDLAGGVANIEVKLDNPACNCNCDLLRLLLPFLPGHPALPSTHPCFVSSFNGKSLVDAPPISGGLSSGMPGNIQRLRK